MKNGVALAAWAQIISDELTPQFSQEEIDVSKKALLTVAQVIGMPKDAAACFLIMCYSQDFAGEYLESISRLVALESLATSEGKVN